MNRRPPEAAAAWLRLLVPVLVYLALRRVLGRLAGEWATPLLLPAALCWAHHDGEPAPAPRLLPALSGLAGGALLGLLAGALPFADEAAPVGPVGLIALCLAGPLCEEAVYRGVALRRGRALMPGWAALALSSALFAAGHGAPVRMLAAFAAGLAFGGAYLLGEAAHPGAGLTAAALCHMAANAAQLFMR